MIKKLLVTAATMTMLASSVTPSLAMGPAGMGMPLKNQFTYIQVAQPTLAPFGFVSYCVKNQDDCKPTEGPRSVEWSHAKMRELRKINYQINQAIQPINDDDGNDTWQANVSKGDCEDFVLTKRKELISRGWPAAALHIAVAYTPDNQGHAVLIVRTSNGDLVLDNRTNAINPWNNTDLKWVMIQSSENPLFWNQIHLG
ncbi:transglutaminase-like cysteine peptidase [Rhizobium rhizoryzae]|uniref:Putative transglutaminase-like cysteine proteinase n=1 Tax=Rhizobium rhizoryzae TaxID=451876 RepID=A0A7W6LMF5_9HYPH|nr:transglutaminase-like cysteine peptidase [Rhizobium rhizoryzae]MBB4145927.1 putative transglutaminase-like cysteine proteinase [Rhizobium rhizoryzae]